NFAGLAFFLSPTNANQFLRTGNFTGNGVLIGFGQFGDVQYDLRGEAPRIFAPLNPNAMLLTNQFGEAIFPCALYRFQVPNANFPNRFGDIIEVSPLMEVIAYQLMSVLGAPPSTIIHDPFVAVTITSIPSTLALPSTLLLWLKDTQPQISGARYKYVLVR